eukprot:30952-Pelagococcus_subviridis.AAC.10
MVPPGLFQRDGRERQCLLLSAAALRRHRDDREGDDARRRGLRAVAADDGQPALVLAKRRVDDEPPAACVGEAIGQSNVLPERRAPRERGRTGSSLTRAAAADFDAALHESDVRLARLPARRALVQRVARARGQTTPFREDPHPGDGLIDSVHREQRRVVVVAAAAAAAAVVAFFSLPLRRRRRRRAKTTQHRDRVVLSRDARADARERGQPRGLVHDHDALVLGQHDRRLRVHARLVDVASHAQPRISRHALVQRRRRRPPALRDVAARGEPREDVGDDRDAPRVQLALPVRAVAAALDALPLKRMMPDEAIEHARALPSGRHLVDHVLDVRNDVSEAVDDDVLARGVGRGRDGVERLDAVPRHDAMRSERGQIYSTTRKPRKGLNSSCIHGRA